MDKNRREYDVEDVKAYDQLSHFQYETPWFPYQASKCRI